MKLPTVRTAATASGLGVLIAVTAILINVGVSYLASPSGEAARPLQLTARAVLDWVVVGSILSPLLETLISSVLGTWLLKRDNRLGVAVFILLLIAIGWVIHGADLGSISRAAGFGALAVWFWRVYRSGGPIQAYIATCLAHAVWNLTLVAAWAVRSIS